MSELKPAFRHLTVHLKAHSQEHPIKVLLPLTAASRRMVDVQLEEGRGLMWNTEHEGDFLREIAYLPETAAQLERADELYKTGLDWHTACQRAKETA